MNCSACGADHTYGLKYCKRCGESLSLPSPAAPTGINLRKLAGMFWAVAVFGIAALAVMFGCAIPMMIFGADRHTLLPIFGMGFATILIIALRLIRQLSRLVRLVEDDYRAARQTGNPVAQSLPQIPAPTHAVPSVTEHTTRNFEQIYQAPRARINQQTPVLKRRVCRSIKRGLATSRYRSGGDHVLPNVRH